MPVTKSAKKALRQNTRKREKNIVKKEAYKKAVKEYRSLLVAKKTEEAKAALPKVFQTLDKAAKTHVIHRGKAARLKSRLSKALAR